MYSWSVGHTHTRGRGGSLTVGADPAARAPRLDGVHASDLVTHRCHTHHLWVVTPHAPAPDALVSGTGGHRGPHGVIIAHPLATLAGACDLVAGLILERTCDPVGVPGTPEGQERRGSGMDGQEPDDTYDEQQAQCGGHLVSTAAGGEVTIREKLNKLQLTGVVILL